jgi:hypothetical protein
LKKSKDKNLFKNKYFGDEKPVRLKKAKTSKEV